MLISILNGPNLNLLGAREPAVYGAATLGDIETLCRARAEALGAVIDFRQTNYEGELVEWIQAAGLPAAVASAKPRSDGLVLNPAALTHTSVAVRDAVTATALPCVEVHLSNIHAREAFRHRSMISDIAMGVICGLGPQGYVAAIDALVAHLARSKQGDPAA